MYLDVWVFIQIRPTVPSLVHHVPEYVLRHFLNNYIDTLNQNFIKFSIYYICDQNNTNIHYKK